VLVSGLYVLVLTFIAWEMGRVGTQLWAWSIALEQVLGDWPLDLISVFALEAVEVGGVDVEMRPLESIVLLIMVDYIGDEFLLVEAALVDGVLGEVGLDDIQFAEVPSAVAIIADAVGVVVVAEIVPS
jgi:hypothetical protein